MTPHLLIFDLDGTLIDSVRHITIATNAALAHARPRTLSARQVALHLVGEPLPQLLPRAVELGGWDRETAAAMTAAYREAYLALPHTADDLYDGVIPLLVHLRARGARLAVCTNKNRAATEAALSGSGIAPLFDLVVCGDDPHPAKPSPAPLMHIAGHLGISPAHAVMIGDGAHDRAAARAAGMPFIAALWGYGIVPAAGDLAARTPADLVSLLHLE